jgi:hypothetical protein
MVNVLKYIRSLHPSTRTYEKHHFGPFFDIFMVNHDVFSDVDHHVAVSLVSLLLLVTKTKWRPVEALVAECHHLCGENKHTSGVC